MLQPASQSCSHIGLASDSAWLTLGAKLKISSLQKTEVGLSQKLEPEGTIVGK